MDLNTVLLGLLIPAVVTLLKWQRDDSQRSIRTEAKVDNLAEEVAGLREWRHSLAQPLQTAQLLREMSQPRPQAPGA